MKQWLLLVLRLPHGASGWRIKTQQNVIDSVLNTSSMGNPTGCFLGTFPLLQPVWADAVPVPNPLRSNCEGFQSDPFRVGLGPRIKIRGKELLWESDSAAF